MRLKLIHRTAGLAAALSMLPAWGGPPSTPSPRPADPLQAQAPVPPVLHRSAFAGYRRLGDTAVGSWRGANDQVARIGGWRTYTREAHAPEAAASSAAPASAPTGAAK